MSLFFCDAIRVLNLRLLELFELLCGVAAEAELIVTMQKSTPRASIVEHLVPAY